jgi:glycerol-3-phosphate dehydrogenase
MLLPIIKNGSLGQNSSSLGLWVYDFLAGVKKTERRKMLSKEKALSYEPLLNKEKLTGGGIYFEYRTDDARLVIELIKTAHQHGAISLNYCEAAKFVYDTTGKIKAVEVLDKLTNKTFVVESEYVVNAAGPGVDLIRKKDNSLHGKRLLLTKGVHLVFPKEKMPLKQAVYFDVADGRMIFAIPRGEITYVGTTDTIYNQDIDRPLVSKSDVDYTINAINDMFPSLNVSASDIQSSWAGLRPLIHEDGKSPSELSRKDEIMVSDSGLISIAGGKLTGYRLMAEKIVTLVVAGLNKQINRSISTLQKQLSGSFESEIALQNFIELNTQSMVFQLKNGYSIWYKHYEYYQLSRYKSSQCFGSGDRLLYRK